MAMSTLRGPGLAEVGGPPGAGAGLRGLLDTQRRATRCAHGSTDAPIQLSKAGRGVVGAEKLLAVIVAEQEGEPGEIGA